MGVVTLAGGGWVVLRDEKALVRSILEADFQGVALSDDLVSSITREFLSNEPKIRGSRVLQMGLRALSGVVGIFGYDTTMKIGPGIDNLTTLRRGIVSHFLLATNYLALDNPRAEKVQYTGMLGCSNPFAEFDRD